MKIGQVYKYKYKELYDFPQYIKIIHLRHKNHCDYSRIDKYCSCRYFLNDKPIYNILVSGLTKEGKIQTAHMDKDVINDKYTLV